MLDAALTYALHDGMPVFPLHWPMGDDPAGCSCSNGRPCRQKSPSPGKHPRTPNGLDDATMDVDLIRSWWTRWPLANIGIPTGAAIGLWVLDIDGDIGKASLAELENTHGTLPRTMTTHTGSGGLHLWWLMPADRDVRNNAAKVAPKIDVRGTGGYVVGAPSLHRSGQRYRLDADLDRPVAAPAWLLDLAAPLPKPKPKARDHEWEPVATPWDPDENRRRFGGMVDAACARIENLTDGRRAALVREAYSLGGHLWWSGWSEAEVAARLVEAGVRSGTEHDPAVAVAAGLRDGIRDRREKPPDTRPGLVRVASRLTVDRVRLAAVSGLDVVEGRAVGADCPSCGQPTASFAVTGWKSSARCPCGWTGGLRALAGGAA